MRVLGVSGRHISNFHEDYNLEEISMLMRKYKLESTEISYKGERVKVDLIDIPNIDWDEMKRNSTKNYYIVEG